MEFKDLDLRTNNIVKESGSWVYAKNILLKEGFIIRTPRGREITQKATEHLI